MRWDNPDHLSRTELWWVDDPRWLGTPEPNDIDELFEQRPWAFASGPIADGLHELPATGAGIVTADLVWDERQRAYEDGLREVYLAAGFQPDHGHHALHLIPAGTRVTVHGLAWYRTARPEDIILQVWSLADGTKLCAWPVERDRPSPLRNVLVPALVAPANSPLATVAAGTALIDRAWAMATAQFPAAV